LLCERRGCLVEFLRLVGQVFQLQAKRATAERIGFHNIRTRRNIRLGDFTNGIRMRYAPGLRTLTLGQALGIEEGTHGTVRNKHFTFCDSFQNALHDCSLL
jgi:hypothetical protein